MLVTLGAACAWNLDHYSSGSGVVPAEADRDGGSSADGGGGPTDAGGATDAPGLTDVHAADGVEAGTYALVVLASGNAGGSVSSSPDGIQCGGTVDGGVAPGCRAAFAAGLEVVLTAHPTQDFVWGGDCETRTNFDCSFKMNGDKQVTISFQNF